MKRKYTGISYIILTIAFTIGFFCSCEGGSNIFSSEYNSGIDNTAISESPLAPDIVAGEIFATSRALISPDEQNFGFFGFARASASNYNSMVNETVPSIIENLEESELEAVEVNYGIFTQMWGSLEETPYSSYFENEEASTTVTLRDDHIGEIRQFVAFRLYDTEGYKYSCCFFYCPDEYSESNAFIDITEVWEYPDRKEVATTRHFYATDQTDKLIAVTDISDEYERTSMLCFNPKTGLTAINIDTYDNIGYIDLSMQNVVQDVAAGNETGFFPDDYPSYEDLTALHNKATTFDELKSVTLEPGTLVPYTGLLGE